MSNCFFFQVHSVVSPSENGRSFYQSLSTIEKGRFVDIIQKKTSKQFFRTYTGGIVPRFLRFLTRYYRRRPSTTIKINALLEFVKFLKCRILNLVVSPPENGRSFYSVCHSVLINYFKLFLLEIK